MPSPADDDDIQNNLVAAGALYMALSMVPGARLEVETEVEDDHATNRLIVRFDFMKSPYRLTVERIPDPPGR